MLAVNSSANRKYKCTLGKRGRLISIVFFIFLGLVVWYPTLQAQQSNGSIDSRNNVSTMSTLNWMTATNGRIGGCIYNGSINPTVSHVTRFSNSSGGKNNGNVMGIDRVGSSRFDRTSTDGGDSMYCMKFRSQVCKKIESSNTLKGGEKKLDNVPRVVVARLPEHLPYRLKKISKYGKITGEGYQIQAESDVDTLVLQYQNVVPSSGRSQDDKESRNRTFLMRGKIPQDNLKYKDVPHLNVNTSGYFRKLHGRKIHSSISDWGNTFEKGVVEDGNGVGGLGRISNRDDQMVFIEYLENQLLNSPEVIPLSPIQVEYQDGTVTIRGVVSTPSARIAAGKVLLTNPQVFCVNNQLTYLRDDEMVTSNPIPQ